MEKRMRFETSSMILHILAMVFMLCDHMWRTVIPGNDWLTCVGRIAFPIFAFMIVEGYFYTKNLGKYVRRLLLFAIISEIPFNLVVGSSIFYPVHQNVLWTFLISIGLIYLNEQAKKTQKIWIQIIVASITIFLGIIIGIATMVDYHCAGILMVFVFYFFREKKWWSYIGQLICLWYINMELMGGLLYEIQILGKTYFFARQGFALLALIPIWLYRGRQGYHSKWLQYIYYIFYPLHLLILGTIKMI